MSGIAGVFHRNGRAVDPEFLSLLLKNVAFRGPDAQDFFLDGSFGFARALLRTTWESENEPAIVRTEGVSLVADARIDNRSALFGELAIPPEDSRSDGELLLAAYVRWGEACIEHCKGDFAFAIWDAKEKKLFCARDHFGVKPFYYAHNNSTFLFSSDVTSLRRAGVSEKLNDQALIDFLVFGHNRVADSTTFEAIHKLPPAHCLTITAEKFSLRRYWKLPDDQQTRFRRHDEYVERFRELLSRSVADRLRCDRVSLFMSGGLDSTSIAALASKSSSRSRSRTEMEALTSIEERIGADPEKKFATLAAQNLGIPIRLLLLDNYQVLDGEASLERDRPEPQVAPFRLAQRDLFAQASTFSRVVLEGSGADPALLATHANGSMTIGLAGDALRAFLPLLFAHRRLPRMGFRTALRRLSSPNISEEVEMPSGLSAVVLQDKALRQRWDSWFDSGATEPRAAARSSLNDVYWPAFFERTEAVPARHHVEMRYPFFDVDLLNYVLGLPPLPWFVEKHILRRALKGVLPDPVRLRPKTLVVHDQILARKADLMRILSAFRPCPVVDRLIDWPRLGDNLGAADQRHMHYLVRVLSLDAWLKAWKLGG